MSENSGETKTLIDGDELFAAITESREVYSAVIPSTGLKIHFRVMNALEAVEAATADTPLKRRVMPIIKSVCSEAGRLLYTVDDLERFEAMPNAIIDELLAVISTRSMCNTDPEQMIRDAKKNCGKTHCDSPPTESHGDSELTSMST